MTSELIPIELSAEQKGQVCGILSVGCDRETAANFVGCSISDIGRAMQRDSSFSATVRRTEAAAELNHMRNVQQAAKDEKHWRASVWWLERRSPERFGARSAGTVTTRQLKAFINMLGDSLSDEIHDDADRQRVLARFDQVINTLDQMILYGMAGMTPAPDESPSLESNVDPDDALDAAVPSDSY